MQLREIKSLMKLKHHNIITLKEVLKEQNTLYLIFEFLEKDLLKEYMDYKSSGTQMSEDKIKNIIRQVAEGLAFMHKHGFFHR